MQRALVLAVLSSLAATAAAAQTTVYERRPLSATGMIRIWNLSGSVRVVGWDRDSVAVSGTVGRGARMSFGGSGTALKLGVEDADALRPAASRLEVRVPVRAQVWIKSATADVTVAGVSGGVEVFSVSGRLLLAGSPRELTAESMGGAIDANVRTRRVRLKTASGDIALRGAVDDADVASVSGTITVRATGLRLARFESIEGDVRVETPVAAGAALSLLNHSGAIELIVPPGTAAEFTVSTFEGPVENALAPRTAAKPLGLKGLQQTFTLGSFNGTRIEVRNFKGRIRLAYE